MTQETVNPAQSRRRWRVLDAAAWVTLLALTFALILELRAMHWATTPTHDLWMFPLPLGHEIDYQRHRDSGSWSLFWQEPGGESTVLFRPASDGALGQAPGN
jgi:hypothetical protein